MQDLILNTKLFIPRTSSALVGRPDVLAKLTQGMNRSLTLVSAPAGFGKTTLLSEWFTAETNQTNPLAWLSLDPEDNDLERFLLYVAAALDTLRTGISDSVLPLLQMAQPPTPSVILTSLINELTATLPAPFFLVLDDFQVITASAVHESVLFLIEHMPPQMRLVILTREDPPLPLARLRARRQLTEIRVTDLRFSLEESGLFLNQVMGLDLTEAEIKTLETRTEGWIAGLQMAAISLAGHVDKTGFIRAFASSHRFIFDFLIEEVLERQPPEIQDFLMKTAILDRMCASLCDAVSGTSDSQRILRQLEQKNLFIIPLDDRPHWYRYHHLFTELLRQQLRTAQRDNVSALHQKACRWHQDHDLVGAAIHHAMLMGDYAIVADLAEQMVFENIERHELLSISNWLANLPAEVMRTKPWLCVALAWALIRTRQYDRAALFLQDAERSLFASRPHDAHIQSHVAAIKAHLAKKNGAMEQVTFYARRSLALLPEREMRLRGLILSLLGASLQRRGEFTAATQAYSEGVAASKAAGDWQNTIEIYGDLTGYFVERGQLFPAFATCQEALKYVELSFKKSGRNPVGAAYIHLRLSTILRHWNRLDESLWQARKSVEIAQQWGSSFRLAYLNLAIACHAVGRRQEAMVAIQQAETVASAESEFWLADVRSIKALLWLEQGDLDAAARWLRESGLTPDDEIPFKRQRLYLTLAQILIAQGKGGDTGALDRALQLLSRLQALFDAAGAQALTLQVLILQASIFQAQRKTAQALTAISQALATGEPGGYIWVFMREGALMKTLLEAAVGRGIAPVYAQMLLDAFESHSQKAGLKEGSADSMLDPLTRRELDVLRCLDTELAVPEIADQLVLSVGTVRTHIKRIYRKLDAHSRFEAIARARKLELL